MNTYYLCVYINIYIYICVCVCLQLFDEHTNIYIYMYSIRVLLCFCFFLHVVCNTRTVPRIALEDLAQNQYQSTYVNMLRRSCKSLVTKATIEGFSLRNTNRFPKIHIPIEKPIRICISWISSIETPKIP